MCGGDVLLILLFLLGCLDGDGVDGDLNLGGAMWMDASPLTPPSFI